MLPKNKADELTKIACEQLEKGLDAKKQRMETIREMEDLYNNKIMEVESDITNIPFPFLASHLDLLYSKIDNPPTLQFKIPNRKILSEKVHGAWTQEMSSTKAGWRRKDRTEKKQALLSGRGVAKVYASSVDNRYQSHYDVVDIYSFVADPTRGFLEDGNYHGEVDIFKTYTSMQNRAKVGVYDKGQVALLQNRKDTLQEGSSAVVQNKLNRLKALGVDIEGTSFVGQKGVNLTEWIMKSDDEWFYLLFDPIAQIWVRADELGNVFKNKKTPFVSWATHYDEYAFWTKGNADDFYPVAEAMRLLLNNALENEKLRTRPMRIVDSAALVDINELQDYVPDNVILRNAGKDPNIITVETPEITGTINLVNYFDTMIQNKSGVAETGVTETDAKVGVFYGKLQQEADRIGTINKEYSESYAHKGYRFFWGLKEHLTKPKQIEMLGKTGIKLAELDQMDFKDVDDVDDVIVSGGSKDDELTEVENQRKLKTLTELSAAYPDRLNPDWVIRSGLKIAGWEEDDVAQALDAEMSLNRESMEEADQAIQSILLNPEQLPDLNMAADNAFAQRMLDYVRENLNYIQLDKNGQEKGIDKKAKRQSDQILRYIASHQKIILQNMARKAKQESIKQMGLQAGIEQPQGAEQPIDIPQKSQTEQRASMAQPFEKPSGTPQGTAQRSQKISKSVRP